LPLASLQPDGPTIQEKFYTSTAQWDEYRRLLIKLKHGDMSIPLTIMGYFNSMLQYGVENFVKKM
jgi:tryptophan synthase alpha chain